VTKVIYENGDSFQNSKIPFRILSGDRILDVIKYLHPNSDVISTYSKIYRLSLPENQQIQKEIPIKNSVSRLQ